MDMALASGFRTVGSESTATIAGNANTKLAATLARRSGVLISNPDTTFDVRVRLTARGAGTPSYANNARIINVGAGNTLAIAAGESVDVYVCNSSNAATTTTVYYQDFAY